MVKQYDLRIRNKCIPVRILMYTDKIIFEGLIISLFFKDKYVIHNRVRELSILTVVKCALQQRRKEN